MKVLIVDDNPSMRRLIRGIVGDIAEVFECEDGADAMPLYEQHRPDWVLMDIRMKAVHGIEATRHLLELDGAARVVIVTDYDDEGLRAAAYVVGACAYVLKEDLSVLRQMIAPPP